MFIKIAQYTIVDQMKAKSFYILLAISMGLLFLMRGCYSTNYMINGQQAGGIWDVSRLIFQVIVLGMLLMVSMLSMRIFTRDQNDGSVQMFLSRPVQRWEYVLGRLFGTWALASGFMLILHSTVLLIVWFQSGNLNSGYIAASVICSVNLLFIVAAICLFSLLMPGFVSVLLALGLLCTGFVSDGGYRLLNSELFAAVTSSGTPPALWRIFYPKLFMVQAYADTLISKNEFMNLGPVHPIINVLGFTLLLIALTLWVFNKKSI